MPKPEPDRGLEIGDRHQEAAVARAEHGELAGIGDGKPDRGGQAEPDRLKRMAEARGLGVRHAQIARHPAAEVAGVGRDHAVLRQNFVDRLAQRARVDELAARRVGMRIVMIVAGADALAHASLRRPACLPLSGARPAGLPPSPWRRQARRAAPRSGSRAAVGSMSICATTASSAISLPRLVVHCVKLTPKPTMRSLSADQLVRDRRGEAAADAERPRIVREQPVAAHRCRQQRADALGERDQRIFGARQHGAAPGQNERPFRARSIASASRRTVRRIRMKAGPASAAVRAGALLSVQPARSAHRAAC